MGFKKVLIQDMGSCQNYGPFLGPYYDTAPNIWATQKGTMILTTTHIRVRGLGSLGFEAWGNLLFVEGGRAGGV